MFISITKELLGTKMAECNEIIMSRAETNIWLVRIFTRLHKYSNT